MEKWQIFSLEPLWSFLFSNFFFSEHYITDNFLFGKKYSKLNMNFCVQKKIANVFDFTWIWRLNFATHTCTLKNEIHSGSRFWVWETDSLKYLAALITFWFWKKISEEKLFKMANFSGAVWFSTKTFLTESK